MAIELQDLVRCTGVDQRRIRYIVEEGIVPGLKQVNKGRGMRREFSLKQALKVAVAAILYEQGFRGKILKNAIKAAAAAPPDFFVLGDEGDPVFLDIFSEDKRFPVDVQLHGLGPLCRQLEEFK